MEKRSGHHGSTRSVLDRQKFAREFTLRVKGDGSGVIEHVYRHQEVARVKADHVPIYQNNPHMQQVFANGRPFLKSQLPFTIKNRFAQRDGMGKLTPTEKYTRRQGEAKTVEHWGQRKLLFSEIEFLTLYGHLAKKVVYAGSAPGTHTNWLSELFPEHAWILVDPAPFDAKATDKITIKQDYFTDEFALTFAGQDSLFICDIRSMDEAHDDDSKEVRVFTDMIWQQKWVEIMQPKVCKVVALGTPVPR